MAGKRKKPVEVEETGAISEMGLSATGNTGLVLVLVLPTGAIGQFDLPMDVLIDVGRQPTAKVFIDDASVSRQHAEIGVGPAGPIVRDLNSRNGTFVNEDRIADQFVGVLLGDTLRFGKVAGQIHRVDAKAKLSVAIEAELDAEGRRVTDIVATLRGRGLDVSGARVFSVLRRAVQEGRARRVADGLFASVSTAPAED